MFEIDNTPFPEKRLVASKYDETFNNLRPGQCLKVDPERVSTTCGALKKWIGRTGRKDVFVRSVKSMPDGYGRVWMLPKHTLKMADVKGRKIVNFG